MITKPAVEVSICIATKNRLTELMVTLEKCRFLIDNPKIEFLVCNDGSTDGTRNFVLDKFPSVVYFENKKSQGIHYCRNLLFDSASAPYAITIDDDVHFVEQISISDIISYFKSNPSCGIIAFRMFWGKKLPIDDLNQFEKHTKVVKSFVAGGHAFRLELWNNLPKLPSWFRFYGEEDYLSLQLFRIKYFVHYVPQFLVHHRVDLKERKKDASNYYRRLRLSIRSGWYLYTIFYPNYVARKNIAYSIFSQFKNRIFMGEIRTFWIILRVILDYLFNLHRIDKRFKLSEKQYREYQKLDDAIIYWLPTKK